MSPIQNVIVVGATGTLGQPVVSALLSAHFTVSILTRSDSSKRPNFPPSVSLKSTDYTPASLTAAFTGQDAVVSCVGFPGLASQAALVEAAAAAGVQRFMPSEYGNDTLNGETLPELTAMLGGKRKVLGQLQGMEGKGEGDGEGLSWTALATGPFLDWGLARAAFGFDIQKKTVSLYDGGDTPFTGTLLATVGEAVARILRKPEETQNKVIRIRSVYTTQNEVLRALERAMGGEKWAVEQVDTADLLASGKEKMSRGDRAGFADLMARQAFEKGTRRSVVAEDGEEGMRVLGFEDISVEEVVKAALVRVEKAKMEKEKGKS